MNSSTSGHDPKQRYEELDLGESLNERSKYVAACRELAYILRNLYSKAPKILQSLMFHDTIAAFRLLPVMSTQAAVSSANVLLQNAEFALPKQKRVLAVADFKHAMVTSKRQSKSQQQEEQDLLEFPEDVLIHVFSYLDMQSLASAGTVSRSWSSAANDACLWESLYDKFFGFPNTCMKANGRTGGELLKCRDSIDPHRLMDVRSNNYWRDKFKITYERLSSKKVAPYRGYCKQCNSIVWLNDSRCYSTHPGGKCKNPNIIPISMDQIVAYVLYDSLPAESSSDSDSDSDELSGSKLFRYSSVVPSRSF